MGMCIFCKIANGEISSEGKIYENDSFFSIKDINPRSEGHSLVVSKKHFKNILDLPQSSGQELLDCIKNTFFEISKESKFEGFNVLQNNFKAADQLVEHVHFHIIPRKKGDGVKLN